MTTYDTLITRNQKLDIGYVLLIDGLRSGFCTHEAMAGSGSGSWVSNTIGNLTAVALTSSLMLPDNLALGIDIRTGKLEPNSVTFRIADINQDLPSLFRASTDGEELLTFDLLPNDDGATATTVQGGDALGRWIDLEYIGSGGSRHGFPCYVTGTTSFAPGFHHRGQNSAAQSLPVSTVSDQPLVHRGRRAVLYQTVYDVTGSQWVSIADCPAVWWGAFQDAGQVDRGIWELTFDGPESWLSQKLNYDIPDSPIPVRASATLDPSGVEGQMAFGFYTRTSDNAQFYVFGESNFGDYQVDANNVVGSIRTALRNVRDNYSGSSGRFSVSFGNNADIDDEGALSIKTDNGSNRWSAMMVGLHEKIWTLLGYDVRAQSTVSWDEDTAVYFFNASDDPIPQVASGSNATPPDGNYYYAYFTTLPVGTVQPPYWGIIDLNNNDSLGRADNDGAWRTYRPAYPGGTFGLYATLNNGSGQKVFLETVDAYYHPGQRYRPIPTDPSDNNLAISIPGVGTCNTMGVFLFSGKRRTQGTDKIFTENQVALCAWQVDALGHMTIDSDTSEPSFMVCQWLEPALFGFNNKKLDSDWIGLASTGEDDNRIHAIPLTVWKFSVDNNDTAWAPALHIMLDTGTGTGWDITPFPATYGTPGMNNVATLTGLTMDRERFGMGLSIPNQLVASSSVWINAFNQVPDGLKKAGVYARGSTTGEELLSHLFESRGLCMGLHGPNGRPTYRPFYYAGIPNPKNAITITTEDMDNEFPTQEIRLGDPIDRVMLEYDLNAVEEKTTQTYMLRSRDRGVRTRANETEVSISDPFLHSRDLPIAGFEQRWQELCNFWERRHFTLTIRVNQPKGYLIFPGTAAVITDPRVVSVLGTYGITSFVGTCIRREHYPESETYLLTILVYAENDNGFRFYSPLAQVRGYASSSNQLFLHDDCLGIGGGYSDIQAFQVPSFSAVSGSLIITLWSWNRGGWSSQNATVTSMTERFGNVTGSYMILAADPTLNRDADTFVTLASDAGINQAAYVETYFSPISNASGTYLDNAASAFGHKWNDK